MSRAVTVAALVFAVSGGIAAGTASADHTSPRPIPGWVCDVLAQRGYNCDPSPLGHANPTPTPTRTPAPTPTQTRTPTPAPEPEPTTPMGGSYAQRVFSQTNTERLRGNLTALRADSCLVDYAQRHAEAMASGRSGFQHQDLQPILRACRVSNVGENIAFGYSSGEAVVEGWMNSPGHRANILNGNFTHLGVGIAESSNRRVYAVQVFGRLL